MLAGPIGRQARPLSHSGASDTGAASAGFAGASPFLSSESVLLIASSCVSSALIFSSRDDSCPRARAAAPSTNNPQRDEMSQTRRGRVTGSLPGDSSRANLIWRAHSIVIHAAARRKPLLVLDGGPPAGDNREVNNAPSSGAGDSTMTRPSHRLLPILLLVVPGVVGAAEPWADPRLEVRDGLAVWIDASRQV